MEWEELEGGGAWEHRRVGTRCHEGVSRDTDLTAYAVVALVPPLQHSRLDHF